MTWGRRVTPSPSTAPGLTTENSPIVTPSPIEVVSTTALGWIVAIWRALYVPLAGPRVHLSSRRMGIERCRLIELPIVANPQGNLVFGEAEGHVPFSISRVFYVYDIPVEAARGGHAHLELE